MPGEAEFGAHLARNEYEFLYPAGIASGGYGTPTLYNLQQFLGHAGATHSQFGTAKVELWTRYVQASGTTHTVYGTPEAKLQRQYVYANGTKFGEVGAHEAQHKNRSVQANGTTFGDYGRPTIYGARQYVQASGTKFGNVGTPAVRNRWHLARVMGSKFGEVGTPLAMLQHRSVFALGETLSELGDPHIQRNEIRPLGIQLYPEFGWPELRNVNRTIRPMGQAHTEFGTGRAENHKLQIDGLTHSETGRPMIRNQFEYLRERGDVLTEFGDTLLYNRNRELYAWHPLDRIYDYDGWYDVPRIRSQFGTPLLTHTWITPGGFDATQFGTAFIAGFTQYVYPESAFDKLLGHAHFISHRHRPVTPDTFDATEFGALSVSPLYLHPEGFTSKSWPVDWGDPGFPWTTRATMNKIAGVTAGDTLQFGLGFISYTPRYIYPEGIQLETRWGDPPYGVMHKFDQYPAPVGFTVNPWDREDWDYRATTFMWEQDFVRPDIPPLSQFGTATAGHA